MTENNENAPSSDSDPQTPPPPAQAPPVPPPPAAEIVETNKDAQTWGMFCHLSALCGFVGIPSFVGPLVVWLIKKDEIPFVDDQGKEALNFQITVLIAMIICIPLAFVIIGIFLAIAVTIVSLVLVIMGTIKSSKGERYRYPICLRLIK